MITVQVEQSSHEHSIDGARVFVLDESGKELVSVNTDRNGLARIPAIDQSARPKYVLVEHPAYFLSGLRWIAGSEEYYILMTRLTLR